MLLVHAAGLERHGGPQVASRKGTQGKGPHRWPRIHPPRPGHTPPGRPPHSTRVSVTSPHLSVRPPPESPCGPDPASPRSTKEPRVPPAPACRSGPSLCGQRAPAGQHPLPSPPLLLGERGKGWTPSDARGQAVHSQGAGGRGRTGAQREDQRDGWGVGEPQPPPHPASPTVHASRSGGHAHACTRTSAGVHQARTP